MRFSRVLRPLVGTALAAAGLAAVPGTAHAQTFVMCNTPALISAINAAAGGDTLFLAPFCTYTLTGVDNSGTGGATGLPVINKTLTLSGVFTTIERSTASGTPNFRIFQVDSPGSLTLTGLTIRNGKTDPGQVGGGIWLTAAGAGLQVNASTITNNEGDGSGGGGIDNDGGTVTVSTSTLSNNRGSFGGGMDMDDGSATFSNSMITGNTATQTGGGIWGGGALTLRNTNVSNNTARSGGGIVSTGPTTDIAGSSISNNTATNSGIAGAGIRNDNGTTLTMNASSVSNNTAANPGSQGGGLYNAGIANLNGSFVTFNRAGDGGGIFTDTSGTTSRVATLVAGNTPNNCAPTAC